MSRFESLARRLVLLWGLTVAGCGGAGPGPEPTSTVDPAPTAGTTPVVDTLTGDALVLAIEADMQRLAELSAVSVDGLVVHTSEGGACYVYPCQAAQSGSPLEADYQRQEARLLALDALAASVAGARDTLAPATDTNADLAALRALQIVQLGGLVTVPQPTTGNCYSLPCADDIARVQVENQRRAAVLHALAVEAANAGL
jgi:hypothetical protein